MTAYAAHAAFQDAVNAAYPTLRFFARTDTPGDPDPLPVLRDEVLPSANRALAGHAVTKLRGKRAVVGNTRDEALVKRRGAV